MKLKLAPTISALLLLPACGPQYQKAQLQPVVAGAQTQNNIIVSAQHMNRNTIHKTFGTRGRKLGYYGLCPIQLSIKNKSTDNVLFDPALTTIKYANHADVAYCLQNRTVFTTASLVGLGLLATGIATLYTLPFLAFYLVAGTATPFLYIGAGTVAGLLVLTPTVSVYYAKQAHTANREISGDIKNVAVTHTRIIPAGQELDVILFTKKENCHNNFDISLINEATQEQTTIRIDTY